MGEELRKRNTDCVYFLASPLTCKKGFDCEYRHSEIARLNPRDCYYWLAGNCLNAACGFRHPPMDGPAGKVVESSECSVPVNKTDVPCYFYLNSFCSKGDTCSFLHGNEITVAAKSTKTGFPSGNKTASANKKGLASTDADAFLHPSKKVASPTVDVTRQCKSLRRPSAENGSHQSASAKKSLPAENVSHQSASAKISKPECEEVVIDELVPLPPAKESNDRRSNAHAIADLSYEEPMTDCSEEENLCESSPGFDVVVGHGSEKSDSDDDPDFLLSTNLEQREVDTKLCWENFEDPSDLGLLYKRESEMHSYDELENEPFIFNDRNIISCSRGKLIKSMFSQKRKLTVLNLDSDEWDRADLQSYLHRDDVSGNRSIIDLSRRRDALSCRTSRNFVKSQKHGLNHTPLGRRLPSHVGKISRASLSENLAFSNSISRCGSFRHSRQYQPCRHNDGYRFARRQHPWFDMSRKPVSRELVTKDHGYNPESVPFKGPKTLSQIKEEKRKVEENRCFSIEKRHRWVGSASTSADFRGPKPLSDILKDKRKVGGACEGNQYLAE